MSKGSWIVVVAIGLTLLALDQGHSQPETNSGASETERQHSAPPKSPPIQVEIVETDPDRDTRESAERESEKREIADLIAQQGMNTATQAMNDATQDMVWWSMVSTVIVGVGTLLLILTLIETKKANATAGAAVAVTYDIGKAQTRAYVGISVPDEKSFNLSGLASGQEPSVTFILKNSGNSPARKFNYLAACGVFDDGFFDEPGEKIIAADDRRPTDTLPQGEVSHCIAEMQRRITDQDLTAIYSKDSGSSFYFFGVAKYEDVFGEGRTVRFCYRLTPLTSEPVYGGAYVNCGWERTHHHNDAD